MKPIVPLLTIASLAIGTAASAAPAKPKKVAQHHAPAKPAKHEPAKHDKPGKAEKHDAKPEAKAEAKPEVKKPIAKAPKEPPKPCFKQAITISANGEDVSLPLAKCDGTLAPHAVEQISIMARPASAQKPKDPAAALAKVRGENLAPGVRRVDARLVERLAKMADHFAKPDHAMKIVFVSGYRPNAAGSYHASARALDFRIDGVKKEELVSFCKTLADTGCGYYPNSPFMHMDVREKGAGHVSWIDASGPGEPARYVTTWPPPRTERMDAPKQEPKQELAKTDKTEKKPCAEENAHMDPADLPALPAPAPEPDHKLANKQ